MLQQAHEQGHDIRASIRAILAETPLGDSPAREPGDRIALNPDVPPELSTTTELPFNQTNSCKVGTMHCGGKHNSAECRDVDDSARKTAYRAPLGNTDRGGMPVFHTSIMARVRTAEW